MAAIDILKIGKDKYLEKNLKQEYKDCYEIWEGDFNIYFQCYMEDSVKKYVIHRIMNGIRDLKNWEEELYSISQEDGEFAIKYGLKSYLIWQGFDYFVKKHFLNDFKERLGCIMKELKEKEETNEDRIFYREVLLMEKRISYMMDEQVEWTGINSITYNDEDKVFLEKYGEENWNFWKHSTEVQKTNYQEIENYYTIYADLYNNYYDDLKLYALMYRNVRLNSYYYDAVSVLYFADKYNEIIGYKDMINTQEKTLKAQIVLLYYENEALFPYVCTKYAGVQFSKNMQPVSIINSLKVFKSGQIPSAFSVNDMTDAQCESILQHKEKLKNDYVSLCDNCDYSDVKLYQEKIQFTKEYYIPMLTGNNYFFTNLGLHIKKIDSSTDLFRRKRILRFLIQKNKEINKFEVLKNEIRNIEVCFNRQITNNKQITNGFSELEQKNMGLRFEIFKLKQEIEEKHSLKSCIAKYRDPFVDIISYLYVERRGKEGRSENENREWENARRKEDEEWEREQYHKIRKLEDASNKIVNEIKEKQKKCADFEDVLNSIIDTPTWLFIYNNQVEIAHYIEKCNIKAYNICWMRNPNGMRNLEYNVHDRDSIAFSFHTYYNKYHIKDMKERHSSIKPQHLMSYWKDNIREEKREQERKEEERLILKQKEEERKREIERQKEEARKEKLRFNQRNRHYLDSGIRFRESDHVYTVSGVFLDSVTTFINNCFPKFDIEFHAKRKAGAMGVAVQEIIEMWEQKGKESRDLGTAMHKKIENYFQDIDCMEDATFKFFKIFANNVKLEPYRTEWAVYDLEHKIAGTIDFVDYQNGEYTIYDWKRSNKIIANGIPVKRDKYGEKANFPLEHLDNSPYYHYALQLSLYKFILERNYNIKISSLRLGIFHPTYNKPYLLEMPYLENEINTIFNLRSEVIF